MTSIYTEQVKSEMSRNGLTAEQKNFIRSAMADPNIDQPTGVPDDVSDSSVLKVFKQELVINMSDYAAANATQVDIIMWDHLRKTKQFQTLFSGECETSVQTNALMTGGVGIYVNEEDKSPFYSQISDAHWGMPVNKEPGETDTYGEVLVLPDDSLGGQMRVIGQSVKVTSEGAESYQSGTVRAWEQTVQPTEAIYVDKNNVGEGVEEGGGPTLYHRLEHVADLKELPPASSSQIMNLKRSKLVGKTNEGVFLINSTDLHGDKIYKPVSKNVVYDTGGNLVSMGGDHQGEYNTTTNTRFGYVSGWINVSGPGNGALAAANPRNYWLSQGLRGVRFSGLNNGAGGAVGPAVLRISVTTIVEQIPSSDDQNMLSIARRSPAKSEAAMQTLSDMRRKMDFAFPAAWNGLGTFTKKLVDLLDKPIADNKFTRAYDKHVSKPAAKAMLGSKALKAIAPVAVSAAVFADTKKRGGKTSQAWKNANFKQAFKQEAINMAQVGAMDAVFGKPAKKAPTFNVPRSYKPPQIDAKTAQKESWLNSPYGIRWANTVERQLLAEKKKNSQYKLPQDVWNALKLVRTFK